MARQCFTAPLSSNAARGVTQLTSLSWGPRHACTSWKAWWARWPLFSRRSRWTWSSRLPRRSLDGPDGWGVAGNLVENGCVPGHVTWGMKHKDSLQKAVMKREPWGLWFVKALDNSISHPPREKHAPLKYVDFQLHIFFYILLWTTLAAGLYSKHISCIWNSATHVSISINTIQQKSYILFCP